MDNVRPQDLPRFIDPLLDYLANALPPPLYSAVFTILSYLLMFASSVFSVAAAIPSLKPWEWDAQTVLPPLIMFLTAYYTLLSLYRTTSFMVRTVFSVLKWGLILGLLGASAGWIFGLDDANNNNAYGGVIGAFRDGLQGREVGGATRRTIRTPRTQQRPRAYDSFTAHEQWRYNEQQAQQADAASDAQRFIESVAGLAGRAVGALGYDVLSNAKSFLDSMTNPVAGGGSNEGGSGSSSTRHTTRNQPRRRAKTSTRRRTASR